MLYGRGDSEAVIDRLLAHAQSGRGGALVLRGEAGIGKTALLAYAGSAAARLAATSESGEPDGPGFQVLSVAGVEAESTLGYAGLQALLTTPGSGGAGPPVDRIDRLPEPQAGAVRGALGLQASAPRAGDDRLLAGLAVVNLLSDHAEHGPVLVLVDDAHWLDRESADALVLAARRLRAEPVAIVFAVREPHAPVLRTPGLAEFRVPRLDGSTAARLLDELHPRLAPDARNRVLAEAGGNPLALRELPGEPAMAGQLGAGDESGADEVGRIFAERLAALPTASQRPLTVAAVDDTGSSDIVLRAIGRLGGSAADLEPAERDRLLWIADGAVVFGHPLVRSAAYANAPAHARIEAHQALAAVLDAPEQQDRRAWHRAAATIGTDEAVAAELEQTAQRARIRGGSSAVAAAYERAAALSSDPEHRVARTIAAARAAADAAAYEQAATLLNGLASQADDTQDLRAGGDAAHTRAAIARAWALLPEGLRPRPTQELLVSAAMELDLDERIWHEAARAAWTANDFETLEKIASCRDTLPRASALAGAAIATNRLNKGQYDDGIRELRDLLAEWPELPEAFDSRTAVDDAGANDPVSLLRDAVLRARLLLIIGEIGQARTVANQLEQHARRVGAISVLPELQVILARCVLFVGSPRDARIAATEGLELANDIGQPVSAAELSAILAEVAALRGDEQTVRSLVTEPLNRGIAPASIHAASAWSLLDLGRRRYDSAYDRLESMLAAGHSMGVPAALPTMVEAAVRAGSSEAAEAPLALYEQWAEHVAQPWTRAVLARCRALVFDQPELFAEAAGPDAFPLDRARAELLHGERLRRDRHAIQARTRLRSALETFERMGATPWAERARSELRATGETRTARERGPTPHDRLTPQELQVARLAASGGSNREIGERLFLSPRTVGYHLAKTYPKLGVRSRTELAGLLATEDGQTDPVEGTVPTGEPTASEG